MNMKRFGCVLGAVLFACTSALASESGVTTDEVGIPHKMMMLAIQVGIILFAARLGGMLAEKIKLPGVLGELGAGILIGPYALGGIRIGDFFANGVFPIPLDAGTFPVTPELYGFCAIASVVLLFLSGVETDMKMFVRYSVAGSFVGVGGVVFSFIFGDLCAVLLLPKLFPHFTGITFLHPAALFLGIMCTATSVGITARILSEQKVIDSEEGVTTMAGAVIDDVLGIIVLAIGLGVIDASDDGGAVNWGRIGMIAVKAFGIWLGATVIGIIAARKISSLLKMFRSRQAIAIMALGLALILAGFFEAHGLAMIIGAYVMGLALSRTDIRYVIHENLAPVYAFLVPLFFCVMGMMVDCKAVFTKPVLIFGVIYSVLAILAKVVGCSIPALACGFNWLGAARIGAGMVPRGEVALIVAGIGLANGFLSPEVFGIGILMTLVTTVAAPPILVGLFKVKKSGLRHPHTGDAMSRPFSFAMPSAESAEMMCVKLIGEFRNEGFFTHTLSREDSIWQVRRDGVEIGIHRDGSDINFECSPSEERFISAAILEVTAELTSLANELAKPIKTNGISHLITDAAPVPHKPGEEIAKVLRHFVMLPELKARSHNEAIDEMLAALISAGVMKAEDVSGIHHELDLREEVMSTGLEHGIAIPHVRSRAVQNIAGVVAVSRQGVSDYPTLDGSAVNILILVLAPADHKSPYLGLISHASSALGESGRAKLLSAKSEGEMRAIFLGE